MCLPPAEHPLDVIVDFAGFHPLQINDLKVGLLRQNLDSSEYYFAVRHYIYISTDSVYMSVVAPA